MAMDPALEELWRCAHELRDAVMAMQLTVVEDRPHNSDVVPVHALGDAVGDLLATVQEMLEATSDGLRAAGDGSGPGTVRDALLRAQQSTGKAGWVLADEVADRARLGDLDALASSRGRAWRQWMAGVDEAIDRCRPPLRDVQEGLLHCWLELTDRLIELLTPPTTSRAHPS
jgi:hypothetical protein